RRGQAAVHSAGGIEMVLTGFGGDNNPAALCLRDVVSEGLGDGVERQCPVCQTTDKLESAHLLPPVGADRAIRPAAAAPRHRSPRTKSEGGDFRDQRCSVYPPIAFSVEEPSSRRP